MTDQYPICQSLPPPDTGAIRRPMVLLVCFLCIIAASIFYIFWRQAASVIETSEQLSKTKEVVSTLDNTLSTLRDAEGSVSGFVVTADPAYLKPYYASRTLLNSDLLNLRKLSGQNRLKSNSERLEQLMREKVAEMDKTIAARTPQNFRDSWLLMVRGHGKRLMDQITESINQMKVTEDAAVTTSANNLRAANGTIMTTLPVLTAVAGILLVLLLVLFFKLRNEKRLNHLRLNHSYKLFESFMNNSPGYAYIKDGQGNYRYMNRSLSERFASEMGKGAVKRDVDWLAPDLAADVAAKDQAVLSESKPIRSVHTITNKLTSEEETWVVVKFPVVDLAHNTLIGGVSVEVTDMKKAEQQIALLNEKLQARVNDLEVLTAELKSARDDAMSASRVKSQFIANMSHEIRTPMSGILGMTELLLENESIDTESRELAEYINTSAHNLLTVVNDLLDFAKLEAGKVALANTRFSIEELIKESVATVAADAMKKSLSVNVVIAKDLPKTVSGDSTRLRQVLLNLIHNAVKFTAAGEVEISAKLAARSGNKALVAFEVRDTGIGITADVQAKLFEPFVQADGSTTRRYGGSGLGLSICRSLIELMSGRIGVRSEAGEGSTFWFTVPLSVAEDNGDHLEDKAA